MTVGWKKNSVIKKTLVWIRIRIGYGFGNSMDPDPGSAKCLDPDLNSTQLKNIQDT
jgi:hypothetical protein